MDLKGMLKAVSTVDSKVLMMAARRAVKKVEQLVASMVAVTDARKAAWKGCVTVALWVAKTVVQMVD